MRKIYKEFENVSIPSDSGKAEYKIYERVVSKDTGEVSLRVSKVANMYNEIQEAGVGTTLNEMIDRYGTGEIINLNLREGSYVDLSQLPSSAMETLNLLKNIDNLDVINNYLRSLNNDNKNHKQEDIKDDLDVKGELEINEKK